MQNAKDTFYVTLRNRLAALNPARTMTLRAVTRPGILAEEAEAAMPQPIPDAFSLRWTGLAADQQLPAILARLTCEIDYVTAGSQACTGLDRGRALAQMDYELLGILEPCAAQKMNFATTPASPMETMVFWSEPVFGPVVPLRDRLSRTATLTVFAFQEAGER